MKQLSGTDDLFLNLERGHQYTHVAGLAIYDPSTAPDGKVRFKDILRFFESRLEASPVFRRRLVTVPFDLDRPYWIEDPDIDVEFHVRHVALPKPGDWRQLCIQVARIHSRPLDRSRPLWEAYVIEGLDNIPGLPPGSFAFYVKFHHCAVDGEAGTEILKAIHTLTPDDFSEAEPARTRYRDREPTAIELYSRALANGAQRVPKLARFSIETAVRAAALGAGTVTDLPRLLQAAELPKAAEVAAKLRKPPATRFAGKVSAHRVVEVVGLPLAAMKRIRQQVEGATINDLFLATVGGALHQYLASKGELPDQTMTCMVPMTLRGADKGQDAGNQITMAIMPLHTELADPLDRLQAVRRGAGKAKAMAGAVGMETAAKLLDLLPVAAAEFAARRLVIPQMSIVVSNVRGPDVPLFMAGARLVNFAPISIVLDGLGLNVTAFSYHGTMWICAVACRDMMPDPAFFADCLRHGFRQLVDAANAQEAGEQGATASDQRPPRARRAKTSRVPAKGRRAARMRRTSDA
ncbi:MAG: wax ester/triacylglycerol synthase family O-acyltransferase [Steroidobacteraceae bacterium]